MARFTAQVDAPVPADVFWRVLVDWPRHGNWVPLTRVTVLTPSAEGVGARFVARTALGPLGFDDVMEVAEWREPASASSDASAPPARCAVVKQGRVVLGGAAFEVEPTPGGSRVTWVEDVEVVPVALTRLFAPLVSVAGRIAFTRALRGAAREAEELARSEGRRV